MKCINTVNKYTHRSPEKHVRKCLFGFIFHVLYPLKPKFPQKKYPYLIITGWR